MSSLADLPELVGFFSYSRKDDEQTEGALSRLRARIQKELRLQLGRDFRLWQDTAAIPNGALWEDEIRRAIAESVFFIPIVTPSSIGSGHCKFEFDSFLAREAALGRNNLIFPILYVRVPALESEQVWRQDDLLKIIGTRQYTDWQKFRHRDLTSPDVAEKVEYFCHNIFEALHQPWLSPQERLNRQAAEARQRADEDERANIAIEAERQRLEREAVARREAEERARGAASAETHRRRLEGEAAAKRAVEEKALAGERRKTEADEKRLRKLGPGRTSRRALVAVCVVGVVLAGSIGLWLADTLRKGSFTECSNCPEMVVVPAGSFTMGSPASEPGRSSDEGPQHQVTIAKPFAIGRFAVTFADWDSCVADGGCNGYKPPDNGWGRGRRPVTNVSWDDAETYVAWLSRKTGKPYRLLSAAEFEYSARAGTTTAYYWGAEIGKGNANCNSCGSQWDNKETAPVGSFAANAFGLYDMAGNVTQWVQDCYHSDYNGTPTDGSAWTSDNCSVRVVRGGSWLSGPQLLRTASSDRYSSIFRISVLGFRVGRTITP